jgi:DNA-binding IclR family transcriptional regulator
MPPPTTGSVLSPVPSFEKRAIASSFIKGLEVLTLVARSPSGLTMPLLRQRCRLPRTSILRLLATLEFFGLVVRKGPAWHTSQRFHDWCSRDMYGELRKRHRPALNRVAAGVDELITLSVAEGEGIQIIDHLPPRHHEAVESLGTFFPLDVTASGKLVLSQRPDLCQGVRDPRLRAEIAAARTTGTAWNRGEVHPNIVAVATWAGRASSLTPMISVVWPRLRFSEDKARQALHLIRRVLVREGFQVLCGAGSLLLGI